MSRFYCETTLKILILSHFSYQWTIKNQIFFKKMENIYQQAIADAKALRASAMANAKAALQEAFEPKIEEMVRLKLSEELEEDQLEEDQLEETWEETKNEGEDPTHMEETELGESDLDEILAELEAIAEDEAPSDTNIVDQSQLEEAEEVEDETEVEDDEVEVDGEESEGEETKEITVSLGDLKDLIDKIKSLDPELAADEVEDDAVATDDEAGSEEVEGEESISLDEILAQLEEEGLEEKKHHDKKEEIEEEKDEMEEGKMKAMEAELEEAKATITQLQESFNEINLLNAKLLYMNKIFKAKTLTESQKIQVVKAFDKATSVKEVKNTFEVLSESVTAKKKSQIQESFGYASKPAGVSPQANVIDADPFVSRWQKLAGI